MKCKAPWGYVVVSPRSNGVLCWCQSDYPAEVKKIRISSRRVEESSDFGFVMVVYAKLYFETYKNNQYINLKIIICNYIL